VNALAVEESLQTRTALRLVSVLFVQLVGGFDMTKFMWVKVPVDAYNRYRKGGHGCPEVTDEFGFIDHATPKTAKAIKRQDRRKQRREAGRIKRAALQEYEREQEEVIAELLEFENEQSTIDDVYFWSEMERELQEEYKREEAEEWNRAQRYYNEQARYDDDYGFELYDWDC
jgi:hypothetical protein